VSIFTHTAISPSPWLRQRPNRYAIRAGRNLPDKEFRYLRTVIVTAAVYWGLESKLRHRSGWPLRLTFQHRAGVTAYTSSCDLARCCVFSKQSLGPSHCGPIGLEDAKSSHPTGAPLLPKLRGYFAEFLDHGSLARLGILYLSTCVGLGYGHPVRSLESFLGGLGVRQLPLKAGRRRASGFCEIRICLDLALRACPGSTNARACLPFRVIPSLA